MTQPEPEARENAREVRWQIVPEVSYLEDKRKAVSGVGHAVRVVAGDRGSSPVQPCFGEFLPAVYRVRRWTLCVNVLHERDSSLNVSSKMSPKLCVSV